jgi:hypothetical protein
MKLEYVPLLKIQRELYGIPRGYERFQAYLQTMIDAGTRDLALPPLVAINPMGKDHVPALDGDDLDWTREWSRRISTRKIGPR